MFQSTPLREGRQNSCRLYELADLFQSTPLREGRHNYDIDYYCCKEFQSTPLREGRQILTYRVKLILVVSIHAPARGAT